MSPTIAVLPLKSFGGAKSRLGEHAQRPELAAAMAADVLAALSQVGGLDEIVVVSRDRPTEHSVAWVPDEQEAGHVAAALLGIDAAVERGADRVLLVPGDCPAMEAGEVEELLLGGRFRLPGGRRRPPSATSPHGGPQRPPSATSPHGGPQRPPSATSLHPTPHVVIVPDRHGSGTNALVLSPPDVIRPSFGPGSFARHAAFARSAGAVLRVAFPPSLLLDVDTPEDLEALQAALRPEAAPRTRALLPVAR